MAERPYLNRDLRDVERRLALVLRYGRVTAVRHDRPRVRVRIGDLITNWLPWGTGRAGGTRTWVPPEVGEQVLVAAPCGDLNQGCVVASLYCDDHPAPGSRADLDRTAYADGAVIEYDSAAGRWSLATPGEARITAGDRASVTAPEVTITGDVTITGTVTVSGDVVAGTVSGDGVSLTTHTHGGVRTGNGRTGQPG